MLFMKNWLRYVVGPAAAQVDHGAGMGVAAAGRVGAVVARVRRRADPMPMLGDRLDVVVGVGVEVLAGLTLVAAALNHVIQVRDHAGREKRLALVVEIDAPRIARAVGEDFEHVLRGVIAPDAGIDRRALFVAACRACPRSNA